MPTLPAALRCSCCSLKSSAYDMWLAWTIAGCLAFVLALLASGIIVHAALTARKVRQRLCVRACSPCRQSALG